MTRPSLRLIMAAALPIFASCVLRTGYSQSNPVTSRPQLIAANETKDSPALPDAPSYSTSLTTPEAAQAAAQSPAPLASEGDDGAQTKRILGIFPNFRSVSANQHLPPQSVREKFTTATQDSFDYSSVFTPALLAGYNQARNNTPEFRQGGIGYGRYLWHSVVDQTSENYFVEFIVPAITHEDTRYYTLGKGGFQKRAFYAIKHVVVTRDDAGKDVFNAGEVVGAALGAALSNAYYPSAERTFGNTAQQWGTSVGVDAFTFALREFWPDVNHALFGGKKPNRN